MCNGGEVYKVCAVSGVSIYSLWDNPWLAHNLCRHDRVSLLQVMCRFGCPEVVTTVQGREFVNELSSQLYKLTNTEHRITSAYHLTGMV